MLERMEPSVLLEAAGLRPTAIRQRVLASLASAGRSLSHREMTDLLADLDRVSIFRSLKLLQKARLVHGVRGVDGVHRFALNPPARQKAGSQVGKGCPGSHPHFLCLRCGAMICLADQDMPHLRVPQGAEVTGKQLLIYGICPSCSSGKLASTAPRSPRAAMR